MPGGMVCSSGMSGPRGPRLCSDGYRFLKKKARRCVVLVLEPEW